MSSHRLGFCPEIAYCKSGQVRHDCSNALLTYALTDNGAEGDIAITRVIPGGQALCEELAGAD